MRRDSTLHSGMEFHPIQTPLLEQNLWGSTSPYQTDVWADVEPALPKMANSIDSESSCAYPDVGTGASETADQEWDSEWKNGSCTDLEEPGRQTPDTPTSHDTLPTPPFDMIVEEEQQGLWCVTPSQRTT